MPVKVLPAEDADMDRIFQVASTAFARNEPSFDTFYPNHWTDEGRATGAARMLQIKNSDRHTVYLKAVDESSGEIVGMAKWNVWQNGERTDPAQVRGNSREYYDTDADEQAANGLAEVFLAQRNAAFDRSGGNLVSLDILAIDPAHQRKKVGDALVKWGASKADELGVETVVESSVFGRGLYEKNGFVFLEQVEVRVPEMNDRSFGSFAWLVRPKKGAQ